MARAASYLAERRPLGPLPSGCRGWHRLEKGGDVRAQADWGLYGVSVN
jgi:hypothetical protein